MEDSKMLLVFFHGEVGGVQHAAVMDFSDLLSTDDEVLFTSYSKDKFDHCFS